MPGVSITTSIIGKIHSFISFVALILVVAIIHYEVCDGGDPSLEK